MEAVPKTEMALIALVLLYFFGAMYLQNDVGLADNGDFTRAMSWVTTGPLEIEQNRPAADTDDWSRRYFNYWIPNWKLELSATKPQTSAYLLWWPGAILNKLLYSEKVLYLPLLSVFSKLILFAVLLLLICWSRLESIFTKTLLVSVVVPSAFFLTSTDYFAYLNSFYQESTTFVYLLLLLVSIVLLRRRPTVLYVVLSLACLLLIATSKPAYFYWPALAVPFIFYAWYSGRDLSLRTPAILSINAVLIASLTIVAQAYRHNDYQKTNAYHSLFYGSLAFSERPAAQLEDLGIEEGAIQCLKQSAFTANGRACLDNYREQMSHSNTIEVFMREPWVMFSTLTHVLDTMQDVSLEYLGKYAIDDPRGQMRSSVPLDHSQVAQEQRFWLPATEFGSLNLWSELKFKWFPTGHALLLTAIGFTAWFMAGLRRPGVHRDLAMVGLLCTITFCADMIVAILGDGTYELIKHIFLANVLFDIAAIAFFGSVSIWCVEHVTRMRSRGLTT